VTAAPLGDDLAAIGWSSTDLQRATGVGRATVWKWLAGRLAVPVYVRTILAQQASVIAMAQHLAAVASPAPGRRRPRQSLVSVPAVQDQTPG
jgi:hypothetical protein